MKKRKNSANPILKFSPPAWAKLLFLRDAGETEIGGFGIATGDDLLRIEDVVLIKQQCTYSEVEFDDGAVADFFDAQVDIGLRPEQFARVWIHTHPGNSPEPSRLDEETFARVFGRADWAVMFILACGGRTYARLRYHTGPGAEIELPVEVDYCEAFEGSEQEAWQAEYEQSVREKIRPRANKSSQSLVATPSRRRIDPWPASDGVAEFYWEDDWPVNSEDYCDLYYDAWLDYTDPAEFPEEVCDVDF